MALEVVQRCCTNCSIVKSVPDIDDSFAEKCCLKSSRDLFLLSCREWHRVRLCIEYSMKVTEANRLFKYNPEYFDEISSDLLVFQRTRI